MPTPVFSKTVTVSEEMLMNNATYSWAQATGGETGVFFFINIHYLIKAI